MTENTKKPVVLITGVGPGTGSSLVRRFAKGGYRVAMMARDRDRLKALEDEIPSPCHVMSPMLRH
jgi:NADP-dependent 3-hydroxy acid dehydrogenase YdfG